MALTIEQALDRIEDMIDEAKKVPFSAGSIRIDGEALRELIDDARAAIPEQINYSNRVLEDREAIIAGAKKEAEQVVRKAEERARALIDNNEITKQARAQGIEIITEANKKAKALKSSAYEYVDNILTDSETSLNASLAEVKRTHSAMKTKTGTK